MKKLTMNNKIQFDKEKEKIDNITNNLSCENYKYLELARNHIQMLETFCLGAKIVPSNEHCDNGLYSLLNRLSDLVYMVHNMIDDLQHLTVHHKKYGGMVKIDDGITEKEIEELIDDISNQYMISHSSVDFKEMINAIIKNKIKPVIHEPEEELPF